MEQNASKLKEWLESHLEQTIFIEKHELQDLDVVHFKLESVEFRSGEDSIDDYLDDALILKGDGSTLNKAGELVPLPQRTYEIVAKGLQLSPSDDKKLLATTERAKYILSIEE